MIAKFLYVLSACYSKPNLPATGLLRKCHRLQLVIVNSSTDNSIRLLWPIITHRRRFQAIVG